MYQLNLLKCNKIKFSKLKNILVIFIRLLISRINNLINESNLSNDKQSVFDQSYMEARNIFHAFLDQLINLTQECVSRYDRALVIGFHGFTESTVEYPDIIFGHIFGKTLDLV